MNPRGPTVYSGAAAPESLTINVTAGTSGIDLTTVSAVILTVKCPDGTVAAWLASVSSATASSMSIVHQFQDSETQQLGTYSILAHCTVPGGTIRIRCTPINVIDPY